MKNELDYKVVPLVWIYGAIVATLLYFFTRDIHGFVWVKSFILGLATSLMNFSLLSKSYKRVLNLPEGERRKYVLTQQMIRLVIYIVILAAVTFSNGKFDLLLTFIGMLSVKIVMFIYVLVKKGEVQ